MFSVALSVEPIVAVSWVAVIGSHVASVLIPNLFIACFDIRLVCPPVSHNALIWLFQGLALSMVATAVPKRVEACASHSEVV